LEKVCPACGGTLELIQEDVFLRFDTPFRFGDCLSMNVFQCTKCRRLEFYSFDSVDAQKPDPDEMIVCPECGQEHSKYINCPHCVLEKGFSSGFHTLGKRKEAEKKERRKKNDVPWEQ